jgi:hypothetical protein
MNYKKGFVIPLIIAIVAILAVGVFIYFFGYSRTWPHPCERKNPPVGFDCSSFNKVSSSTPIIGGDEDEHGCLGPAGYSWCEVKNKCLKVWEEKCETTPINSGPGDKDGFVACTMDAMQCPDGTYVGRSAPDCKFICPSQIIKPQDIISKIVSDIYATTTPINLYANIRWGENGTYRNKDVSAFGINISNTDSNIIESKYLRTKAFLEQNSFVKNGANSIGVFSPTTTSRELVGYQNGNTICLLDISSVETKKYFLSLKCGIFDGSFEAMQR